MIIYVYNRAELQAVISAAQMELRPLEVRTDSSYVTNGVQRGPHGWKETLYWKKGKPIPNADLWRQLSDILAQRQGMTFKVTKVKGHATMEDVEGGAVSGADKFGNDSADSLAVAGAARNHPQNKQGLQQHHAILFTIAVQKLMLSISTARAAAEKAREGKDSVSEAESEDSSHSSHSSDSSSSSSSGAISIATVPE